MSECVVVKMVNDEELKISLLRQVQIDKIICVTKVSSPVFPIIISYL